MAPDTDQISAIRASSCSAIVALPHFVSRSVNATCRVYPGVVGSAAGAAHKYEGNQNQFYLCRTRKTRHGEVASHYIFATLRGTVSQHEEWYTVAVLQDDEDT